MAESKNTLKQCSRCKKLITTENVKRWLGIQRVNTNFDLLLFDCFCGGQNSVKIKILTKNE